MAEFFRAAKQQDVPENKGVVSQIQGRSIAIFHYQGKFFAMANICPHRGGPLGEGEIDKGLVRCPWHGWTFDLKTGTHPDNQRVKVPTYPVELRDDEVWVQL